MTMTTWVLVLTLALLNGAALILWLATARFRFVLTGPQLSSFTRKLGRDLRRRVAPLTQRASRVATRGQVVPAAVSLDSWIDEVERAESSKQPEPHGSEAWWREWADSGGALPRAAGSCRTRTSGDAPAA